MEVGTPEGGRGSSSRPLRDALTGEAPARHLPKCGDDEHVGDDYDGGADDADDDDADDDDADHAGDRPYLGVVRPQLST
eukprot:4997018-Pyramimonas_sp.AAC.1